MHNHAGMHTHALDQKAPERLARVVGRHRTWKRNRAARRDLVVTEAAVTALFGMTQTDAALALDVSVSTLQRVCRRLGITRWGKPRPTAEAEAEAMAQGFFS
jgi:hypothetical protein